MLEVQVNFWAVLAASVAAMILGSLWYSPLLFAKAWMRAIGKDPNDTVEMDHMKKGAGHAYVGMFITALITAYILAHFAQYAGATTVMGGLQLGFWAWLGFIATVQLGTVLFENRSKKLYFINTGFQLVNMLAMGVILALWR